ncbi:MAG: OB-fold domain-containing protein [Gordonia sp. (in: high G+C Gram-positive bacteria)]
MSPRPAPASPVVDVPEPETEILTADLTLSFDYTRSLGPVLSQFALGLRDGRIVGGRTSDGRVLVPPAEFDPATGVATTELVDVGSAGTVTSWSWQPEPTAPQPLSTPFTWALIRLDGADSALLHAVDVESTKQMRTGMRVEAVWREVRTGRIDDIVCFVPEEDRTLRQAQGSGEQSHGAEHAQGARELITTPVALSVEHSASEVESWYLEGLKAGKLCGGRVDTGEVYFPPRVASPADGSKTVERVELPDTGTVTTFCIVNVPFLGQQITPPYVAAYVLLDGADIPFLHLILDCPADEVRMGMRVKAVWRPESEWGHTLRNVNHFAPSGEPDAPFESYRDHL